MHHEPGLGDHPGLYRHLREKVVRAGSKWAVSVEVPRAELTRGVSHDSCKCLSSIAVTSLTRRLAALDIGLVLRTKRSPSTNHMPGRCTFWSWQIAPVSCAISNSLPGRTASRKERTSSSKFLNPCDASTASTSRGTGASTSNRS